MGKFNLMLFVLLVVNVAITSVFSAAAVLPLRIPDRPIAEQYRVLPWYGCLCCMERINHQFMDDLALTHDLLTSLKMTSPKSLRELFLKSQNPLYTLSNDVAPQLRGLGFLNHAGQVKESWVFPIVCMLIHAPAELPIIHNRAQVEDLARKFPAIIDQLENTNLNDIPPRSYEILATEYSLTADETTITAEELDRIFTINREMDHSELFTTELTLTTLDDLFFNLGMIVFIEYE